MDQSLIEIQIEGGIVGYYNVRGILIDWEKINLGDIFYLDSARFSPKPGSAAAPTGEYKVHWYGTRQGADGKIDLLILR